MTATRLLIRTMNKSFLAQIAAHTELDVDPSSAYCMHKIVQNSKQWETHMIEHIDGSVEPESPQCFLREILEESTGMRYAVVFSRAVCSPLIHHK